MPRPGSRWSRGRRATKARAGGAATCPNARVKDVPGIRHELVARVRREIVAGAYDDPAKLEAALERLLARLADD